MPADIAAMLTEAAWLTRLARSLVADPAEAADAVQETWLAAMRRPPDPGRPVRPWLRRVLVNTLRMRHRSSRRRDSREAASELLVDPTPTPEQLVERARVERRLGDLVLALAEPYRATVLLRYREGCSAEEIARQQGIPSATVRTRLKTALDQLRDEMDDAEPRKWRPLFVPAVAANTTLFRRLVMANMATKAGVGIAVVLALLLLVGGVWWSQREAPRGDAAGASRAAIGSAREKQRATAGWDPAALFAQAGVPARAIGGRVTLDGKPFVGATVHLADALTRTPLAEVTSASDGSFTLGIRAAVEYVLVATAPDKTAATLKVDLRAPIDASRLELVLVACSSKLAGTVHDASGGVIAHARVTREDAPWPVAETDAAGRYQLCLPFGHVQIAFAAEGYAGRVLAVPIDRDTQRDIALVPEATIAGTVVDASDRPVPGAWISIEPAGSQPAAVGDEHDATSAGPSGPDGTFRIDRVSPGSQRIVAFAPGALTATPVGVVAIAGRVIEGVVLRVVPATAMTGIVVAGTSPVAGAAVGVRIGNRDLFGTLARTQADGRFAIERLPRGVLTVTVSGHSVTAPQSVHIGDTNPVDVRIEVTPLGTITGRVLRAGKPIADAQVSCNYGRINYARSDRDGRYACVGLPPGRYTLEASAGDGSWGMFGEPLALGAGEIRERDLELTHSAELCGRVVDEARRPFSGVEVRVTERSLDETATDLTGDDGKFCGRFLSGGTYAITTFTGSQRLEPVEPIPPIKIAAPDGRATVEVALRRPSLAIAGTVSDSSGAPVPDAIVRVVAAPRGSAPMFRQAAPATVATTDAAGAFRIAPLAAGDYALVASGRDGSESVLASVAAGVTDLAITLDPAGAIEGRVLGFAQTPSVAGILLRGSRTSVRVQLDGDRFRAEGLSPGTYIFTAHTGLGESVAREITVTPGRTMTVDLTSPGSGTIEVRLYDWKSKAPLAGMSCMAIARVGNRVGNMYTPPTQPRRSDATGRFVIDPAPAGDVYVGCNGGGTDGIRLVSLAPHQRLELEMPIVAAGPARDVGFTLDLAHQLEELEPAGPGERAGLIAGDKIVSVDGAPMAQLSPAGVMRVIANRPIGATATLGIERTGQPATVSLAVAAPR